MCLVSLPSFFWQLYRTNACILQCLLASTCSYISISPYDCKLTLFFLTPAASHRFCLCFMISTHSERDPYRFHTCTFIYNIFELSSAFPYFSPTYCSCCSLYDFRSPESLLTGFLTCCSFFFWPNPVNVMQN